MGASYMVRLSSALLVFLLVASEASSLQLSREISRLPAGERPTAAETAAAKRDEEIQAAHEAEVWHRIEPEIQAWAARGKPYFPSAAVPGDLPQAGVPAFPGAEGGGAFSFGGRGGRVYVVTNLADSGPGTFREACEAAGPRIVVFNVAGVIHLAIPIHIRAPYLTIAGQSAPGDGVCIAGRTTNIDTHDVVVRFLRFRRGATSLFDRDDALGGEPVGNVIIDHCSVSWGLDENLSLYRHVYTPSAGTSLKLPTVNLTIQWCISSEGLDKYDHAFGGTWGGRNTLFHHDLFADNTGRNPSIGMSYDFNFVNNVLFNWRHRTLDGGDRDSQVNCINNYYKPGPITPDSAVRHRLGEPQPSTTKEDATPRFGQWYVAGNVVEGDPVVTADNWSGGVQLKVGRPEDDAGGPLTPAVQALMTQIRMERPFPLPPMKLESATGALASVLDGAGATLPVRDAVDQRIITQVRTGQVAPGPGRGIITDIAQVGGYPEYRGAPQSDLGPDGIPGWWKKKYGLDSSDPTLAAKDLHGDGYTVIEKYLDGLNPNEKIDPRDSKDSHSLTTTRLRPQL
jgi:hypothetical protein